MIIASLLDSCNLYTYTSIKFAKVKLKHSTYTSTKKKEGVLRGIESRGFYNPYDFIQQFLVQVLSFIPKFQLLY